jgi:enoyl-CoA hydratase
MAADAVGSGAAAGVGYNQPQIGRPPMSFDNLLVEREGRVAILTIQRPQRLKAVDALTLDERRQAVLTLQQDDRIRCVVLTGGGKKAFVAGADLSELARDAPELAGQRALAGWHVCDLAGSW